MELYGTTTSPFVRRVRVVAAAVGEPVTLINTATDDGQARLRTLTPIGKVPIATLDDRTLFDSRVIIDWLLVHRGYRGVTPPRDAWLEANLVNAVDAALDATIALFYLRREGVDLEAIPRTAVQRARTREIFAWLEARLTPDRRRIACGDGPHPAADDDTLDLPTLSLLCTLDWMDFRDAYPTADHPGLAPLRAAWAGHPHLVATPAARVALGPGVGTPAPL
jgi:glutathione S-transferase